LFPGASFYADFMANEGFNGSFATAASLLTTTRASNAYADNTAGVWSLFGSGVPRITDKGLLVEGARTNSIRNNSMQGAVAGTPGTVPTNWTLIATGLTISVVGLGIENGVDYIDIRLSGTTGSTSATLFFDTTTAITAASGQTWSQSLFAALVGGSLANINSTTVTIQERTAAGGFVANNASADFKGSLTSSLARFSSTATLAGGGTVERTVQVLTIAYSNGVAVDLTLRIGWPQLELGGFSSSPIRTTSGAATRAADNIVLAAPSLVSTEVGTLFSEWQTGATVNVTRIHGLRPRVDGSNFITTQVAGAGNLNYNASTAGVQQFNLDTTATVTGDVVRGAFAYATDDIAMANSIEAGILSDTSATMPTSGGVVGVASSGTGSVQLWGYQRRVAYFPTRLTNAQLQALTQ